MAQIRRPSQNSTQLLTYEDFHPSSDWTHDLNFHVLLVDLPGFKKEEVKVQVDNSWKVTASGERKLNENKYSRFKQVYDIPKDSDIDKITGRFDGGLLFIIIPKKKDEIVEETKKDEGKTQELPKNDNKPEPGNGVLGKKKEETERLEKKESLNEERKERIEKEDPKKNVDDKPENVHVLPGIKKKEEIKRTESKEDSKEEKIESWKRKAEVLKEKAEGLEVYLENAKEIISKNKTAIVTAVFALSVGLYISHRLRSGRQ